MAERRAPAAPRLGVASLKPLIFALSLLPFARLFWLGWHDSLGANPVEFVTRSMGLWTLVFVCITLSITPLRKLTGLNALIRLRRMLGLFAFFYGLVHLSTYVWFDQWFDFPAMLADIVKRPFITVGFAAMMLMLPLALTSTDAMMRRLGRRWQRLHRLVYAVAILGVVHFWWHKAGKNDLLEPAIYAVIVALLLGMRVFLARAKARAATLRSGSRVRKASLERE